MHWSLNVQIGTMMEQPVQHLRRLARGCGDDGGMKRRVALRDIAVEGDGRLRALVRIDRTGRLGTAIEREVLTIRARKSTRLNSRHYCASRMPLSACNTKTFHRK